MRVVILLAIAASTVQLFLGKAQRRGIAVSRVEHTAEDADLSSIGVDLSASNDDVSLQVREVGMGE